MVNRFQRGSWKVRGKKKMVYGCTKAWRKSCHPPTELNMQNVRPKVISKLVGHASEAFTSRVYDHAEQREIGDALAVRGRRLEPNVEPNRSVN